MAKMTEDELLAIVDHEIKASTDTKLSAERKTAYEYYLGEKKGRLAPPESEGRSTVVSNDTADTIEWILPALLRIFTAGDEAVIFEGQGIEDEELAKQATDWANYVFYRQNPGFLILYSWFKDALLLRTGITKTWWDQSKDVTTEEYTGMNPEELALMMQDGSVEIIEQAQDETGFSVKVRRTKNTSKICIEAVPNDEFSFNRKARSADRILSCHHKLERTVSELRLAGYKNVEQIQGDDCGAEWSLEAQAREDDLLGQGDSLDPSMRSVWITESYLQIDFDGDGIAEWRKIVKSGSIILDNEEIDEHPFSIITPIIMPHKITGRSVADLVMDLQEIKTAIIRQSIDGLFLQNNPRHYVDITKGVNIDDLLDSRIGGIVRGKGENGVTPLVSGGPSPNTLPMLEYIDSTKENRTGVTRYNQGIDANSLNKTASGINAIMGAAQQRIDLIARIFAETGVKDLFLKILKLSSQYKDEAQVIRLRGSYQTIDPRAWKTQYDVQVNVGLGTGNKDQMAAHLMNLMNVQKEAMMGGLPIVTPKKIYNSASKLAVNMGFKSGDEFFLDPESPEGQQYMASQPPKQDPEIVKAQSQAQLDKQKAQQEHQRKMLLDQSDLEKEAATFHKEAQKESRQQEQAHAEKMAKIEADKQAALTKAQNDLEIQTMKIQYERDIKLQAELMKAAVQHMSNQQTAQIQMAQASHQAGLETERAHAEANKPEPVEQPDTMAPVMEMVKAVTETLKDVTKNLSKPRKPLTITTPKGDKYTASE